MCGMSYNSNCFRLILGLSMMSWILRCQQGTIQAGGGSIMTWDMCTWHGLGLEHVTDQ